MKNPETTIDQLKSLLSAAQCDTFFGKLLSSASEEFLDEVLDGLDPDIVNVCDAVLGLKDQDDVAKRIPLLNLQSDARFGVEWELMVSKLMDCILELGDEEGGYVEQEQKWHQPTFDGYSFSRDLEEVFEELAPLVGRAHELELAEPGFFDEILSDIETGWASYPEWMGAEYEELMLGEHAADCMITWKWLNRDSIQDFVEAVNELLGGKRIDISRHSLPSFVFYCSEEERSELYRYLIELEKLADWQEAFADVRHTWHKLLHALTESEEPTKFLEESRRLLNENWRYGIPVYRDLMGKGQAEEAEKCCAVTVRECVRQRDQYRLHEGENWTLESDLLINALYPSDVSPVLLEILND